MKELIISSVGMVRKVRSIAVDSFSWLTTRISLIVLYFTVFTLYGVVMRVLNRNPLSRPREDGSYWEEYTVENDGIEDFRRKY